MHPLPLDKSLHRRFLSKSDLHCLELIYVIDVSWCDTFIIMANCLLNKAGLIVCFKTSDNTLVIWVNMYSQVWLKNFNSNVLKTFRDNMAQKVILKEKNLSF